ncbi:DUF1634 domain-containing protein [Occallatibacter riparius]|uniref:DUF1634 domain-containing protein n=1 Tax=Occallatibacter riparius TaxID=1002689 RepID=A0A9J7BH82_9BACT|nr:DUF1634 domain-containing protein [Occallatibacter riparius]UWZ81763.1 DUF1634 domain-containing protein [Occallatibacter riparius]
MDDRRLETIMGNLLRVGVLLAAGLVTIGALVYLAQHYAGHISFHNFIEESADLRTVGGIFKLATQFNSLGLIQFGLLLLIATPVARVVFAVIGFALERDRLYVAVSAIVLVILVISLLHAT